MRDFSWKYFSATGEIDAYLLLKEYESLVPNQEVGINAVPDEMVENDTRFEAWTE